MANDGRLKRWIRVFYLCGSFCHTWRPLCFPLIWWRMYRLMLQTPCTLFSFFSRFLANLNSLSADIICYFLCGNKQLSNAVSCFLSESPAPWSCIHLWRWQFLFCYEGWVIPMQPHMNQLSTYCRFQLKPLAHREVTGVVICHYLNKLELNLQSRKSTTDGSCSPIWCSCQARNCKLMGGVAN